MMSMLIVAIASQKGGVGKTTLAVNLGVELYRQKVRVVVIDMDAQGSATYALGLIPNEQAGFERWLAGEDVLSTRTAVPLIPGGSDTAYIAWRSPDILSRAIARLDAELVILDCPPSLVPSTVAALVTAHRVLVPVLADPLVLVGLAQILDTLTDVNPKARVDVVRSKYKVQLKMTTEADEMLVADPRFNLLRICIPDNVAIAESAGHGIPVKDYAGNSKGAKAFKAIASEVIKEWGLKHGK